MAKKYREVAKILKKHGWTRVRQTGGHERWVHPDGRAITLPGGGHANRELSVGTLASLRRETRIKELR